MDIQQKLTAFALVATTWAMWILAGLTAGGVAVAVQRAIGLIQTSVRPSVRGRTRETRILFPVQ